MIIHSHKTGRNITCIAGHPDEECIATGDTSGRVLVWRNILQHNKSIRATYHWHTLPVTEIAFSKSGKSVLFLRISLCIVYLLM